MFARVILSAAVAGGLVGLPGCGPGRLDDSRTWSLEAGDAQGLDLPAQTKPQRVTVEFDAPANEVGVFVFKKADVPTDDDMVTVAAAKALGSKTGEKSGTLSVDVPENTPALVVVRATKGKTEVKVHVTNRK